MAQYIGHNSASLGFISNPHDAAICRSERDAQLYCDLEGIGHSVFLGALDKARHADIVKGLQATSIDHGALGQVVPANVPSAVSAQPVAGKGGTFGV